MADSQVCATRESRTRAKYASPLAGALSSLICTLLLWAPVGHGAPNITIPAISPADTYYVVHTSPTSVGTPTGVVTYMSNYGLQFPPSTLASSTITTAPFVISATSSGTLQSLTVQLRAANSSVILADFTLDGTASSSSRNLITNVDLWSTYKLAGNKWTLTITAVDSTGSKSKNVTLRTHPTYTWYDSTVSSWRQDRLPALTAAATGLTNNACNFLQALPSGSYTGQPVAAGPNVYCVQTGTTLSTSSNFGNSQYAPTASNIITFTYSDVDANVTTFPIALRNMTASALSVHVTSQAQFQNSSLFSPSLKVIGWNAYAGTFTLQLASAIQPSVYPGQYQVTISLLNQVGSGATLTLTLSMSSMSLNNGIPTGFSRPFVLYSSFYSTTKSGWFANRAPQITSPSSFTTTVYYIQEMMPANNVSSKLTTVNTGVGTAASITITDSDTSYGATGMPAGLFDARYVKLTAVSATNTTSGQTVTNFGTYSVPKWNASVTLVGTTFYMGLFLGAGVLDYESFKQWKYSIQIWDGHGASWGVWPTLVTINVINVNEPPILTAKALSRPIFNVFENATQGQTIDIPGSSSDSILESTWVSDSDLNQRMLLSILNITATLPNGQPVPPPVNDTAPDYSDAFGADVCGGSLSVESIAGSLYAGTSPNFTLALRICDSGTPSLCAPDFFVILVIVEANRQPVPANDTVLLYVAENSGSGTPVLLSDPSLTTLATDPNTMASPPAWYTLVFSLLSNPGNNFAINSTTGALAVAPGGGGPVSLNFEDPSANSYTLLVKVSDVEGLFTFFTALVTVTDINEPPVFDATSLSVERAVLESTPLSLHYVGEMVGDAVFANDPDANDQTGLFYALVNGASTPLFSVDNATGQLSLTTAGASATAFDYEGGPRVYNVTLQVTDNGGLSSTASVFVDILDVNEAPTAQLKVFTVPENSAVNSIVGLLNGTDPEMDFLFYAIAGPGAAGFTLQNQGRTLFVANSGLLNYETTPVLRFTYTVTDSGSPDGTILTSLPANVTVNLIDVNEAPSFTNATCVMSVLENQATGAVAGFLVATDPDVGQTSQLVFSFATTSLVVTPNPRATSGQTFQTLPLNIGTSTGVITTASSFNYELTTAIALQARVQDPGNLLSTMTCTLNVIDVNEAPVFTQPTYTMFIPKTAGLGFSAGTVTAYDPDVNDAVTYNISLATNSSTRAEFTINNATGLITTLINHGNPNNLPASISFTVYVTATDKSGLQSTATVYISTTEINSPPYFASGSYARSIAENVAINTQVTGGAVTGNDLDTSDVCCLQYSIIGGNSGNVFSIGSGNGVITSLGSINFEAVSSYTLTVQVADPGGLTGTTQVTISVVDVNEVPSWSTSNLAFTIDENSPIGARTTPMQAIASDPDAADAGQLSYTLLTPLVPFVINASGYISVSQASLNFEIKSTYTLSIRAMDTGWDGLGNKSATATITVSLNNINDAPVQVDRTIAANENVGLALITTAAATDEDNGQSLLYSFSRRSQFCWFTDFTSVPANAAVQVPAFPAAPASSTDAATVVFRVKSSVSGTVRVLAAKTRPPYNGTMQWYEYAFTATSTTARLCSGSSWSCTTPTAISTVNTGLISSSGVWSNLYLSYFINGSHVVGRRSSNEVDAVMTPLLSFTDTTFTPTYYAVSSSDSSSTRVSSLCYTPESALASPSGYQNASAPSTSLGINPSTGAITSSGDGFNFEAAPVIGIEVRVMDVQTSTQLSPFNLTDFGVVLVQVVDVDERPTFVLQSCQGGSYIACMTVAENSIGGTAVAALPAASDPDTPGTLFATLSYTLSASGNLVGSRTAFVLAGTALSVSTPTPALNYEGQPTFVLSVSVQDGGGLSSNGQLYVSLLDVNEQPTISLSPLSVEENVAYGTSVSLPIVCTDPDTPGSDNAALVYSVVSASVSNVFSVNTTSGQVYTTGSLDYESINRYWALIRCTDRNGGSGSLYSEANFTINIINVNEPPTIAPQTRSMPENATAGAFAGSPLEASDPDFNSALSFVIVGGNGSSLFRINRCGGTIELIPGQSLDYESAQMWALLVEVADDGIPALTAQAWMTVIVLDSDDAPIVPDQSRSIAENSIAGALVGLPVTYTDPDVFGGKVIWFTETFSIIGGNERGIFDINSTTGQVFIVAGGPVLLNFEDSTSNRYTLTIRVTDGGNMMGQCAFSVVVTDVNEQPIWLDPSYNFARSIDENCPRSPRSVNENVGSPITVNDPDFGQTANLVIAIVAGNENGYFFVSTATAGAPQLKLTATGAPALDYETRNKYIITLKATDNGAPQLFTLINITININNRNEAPVFVGAPFSRTLMENATVSTRIGTALTAVDPEESLLAYSITSGNSQGVFAVDSLTGMLFVADTTNLDFETTPTYTLGLMVQDQGVPEGPSAVLSAATTIAVTIVDVNEAPYFSGSSNTLSIPENSASGTLIGYLQVNDPDAADVGRLSVRIVSQDTTVSGLLPFVVDNDGALRVAGSNTTYTPDLDFEAKVVYTLTAQVNDTGWDGMGSKSSIKTFVVRLTNVNEAPFFVQSTYSLAVPRLVRYGSSLGFIYARDPDAGDKITWSYNPSLSNVAYNGSTIFGLNTTSGLVYSLRTNASSLTIGDMFNMTVTVIDVGGLSATILVTLTVTDAAEPPLIYDQSRQVNENAAVDVLVGDPIVVAEYDPTTIYQWTIIGGNTNNAFRIDSTTGQIQVNATAPLNFEVTPSFDLLVTVADVTGHTRLAAQCHVYISMIDVNEAPSLPPIIVMSINENSFAGALVGTVVGSDPDVYDGVYGRLTYSIVTAGTPFNVNASSGQVMLFNPILDFETKTTWTFTVKVTDANFDGRGALSASQTVTVSVLNMNDPPIMVDLIGGVRENAPLTSVKGMQYTDQDSGQGHNFTFTRPDAVCWFQSIATANNVYRVPIGLPISPAPVLVSFRARSTGTIKLTFDLGSSSGSRYEFTVSQSTVSVFKCAASSCGGAIGGAVNVALLVSPGGPSVLANLWASVDRVTGQLKFGTSASPDKNATRITLLSTTDSPVLNVSSITVTGTTTDSYFTSVCFDRPDAAQRNAFAIDTIVGTVTTSADTDGGSLDYETQQQYGLEVKVTDRPYNGLMPEWSSDYGVLIVQVSDVNEAPFWNYIACGNGSYVSCLSIAENTPIGTIAGTIASAIDPDFLAVPAQTLSYSLRPNNNQVGTSAIFTIGSSSKTVTLSQSVLNFEQRSTYELVATALDSGSPTLSSDATFLITIIDVDETPMIPDGQTVAVDENSPVDTLVGSPISASDPDTAGTLFATLNFTITGGNGSALFAINATTGQVAVKQATLDFERNNRYSVSVRVTDGGGLFKDATVYINLNDINEAPVLLPQNRSISEDVTAPAPAGQGLSAYDQDAGQSLSFSIIGGNGSALFRINRCAGIIELKPGFALDYETARVYTLQVLVVDDGVPVLSANATMLVFVLDANDAPTIVDQTRTIAENSVSPTVVGAAFPWVDPDTFGGNTIWFTMTWQILSGNDRNVFAINASSGQVYIANGGNSLLNYEDSNSNFYTLLIKVTDGGGLSSTAAMAITVTDVNEAPIVTDSTLTRNIDENCPRSIRSVNEDVGTRILAFDPDVGQTANLTFTITGGDPLSYFWIVATGANAGQIRLRAAGAAGLDYETQTNYSLAVTVNDNGYLVSTGLYAPILNTTVIVKININNRNEVPVFTAQSRAVYENASLLDLVGVPLVATDPEERVGAGLTFSITAGGAGIFGINALTGQIYIANNANLNYEATQSYLLTVQVSDTGVPEGSAYSLSASASITLTILDVNEPPTLSSGSFSIAENSALGVVVGAVLPLAADPDTLNPSFQLDSFSIVAMTPTAGAVLSTTPFAINATTGVITVGGVNGSTTGAASDLDFETRSTYTIIVRVTDKGGLSATSTMTVTLTNVNEPPRWSTVPLLFARAMELQDVGQALINYVIDPDTAVGATGEQLTFTFGIPSGNTNNIFAVVSSNGQVQVVNDTALLFPLGLLVGPQYNLTIVVQDRGVNGPRLSATNVVTVQTVDNNYPPTVPNYVFNITENTPVASLVGLIYGSDRNYAEGQTVTYSLSAAGININRAFPFTISTLTGTGNGNVGVGRIAVASDPLQAGLALWSNLDFEAPRKTSIGFNKYLMTVTATDSHVTHLTATGAVTVNIMDVPEDPYFSPSRVPNSGYFTLTVPENSPRFTQLTVDPVQSCNPGSGVGGLMALDDDIADTAVGALQYAWKTAGATPAQLAAMGMFTINATSGVVTVSASGAAAGALDFETMRNYTLTVAVTDSTGRRDEAIVTVVLIDVNEPAYFVGTGLNNAGGSGVSFLITSESTATGTTLGRIAASDVDAGLPGVLTYSLLANQESATLSIDPNTGVITLLSALDYEDKDIYTPTILVTDRSATPITVNISIVLLVNDVSDATITGIRLAPGEAAAGRGVTIGSGTDYDSTHASMSIVFQTAGGTGVIISGTGLGFSSRKLAFMSIPSTMTTINASYGPKDSETMYTASNCSVYTPNTEIICYTAPGFDYKHYWKVNISTPSPRSVSNSPPISSFVTAYMRPNITAVYLASAAATPFDSDANAMTTEGGTDIIVEGRDMGPLGSLPLQFMYGPAFGYLSPLCTYLVPHFKLSCQSAPGVGRDLQFKLQVGISGSQCSIAFAAAPVRYSSPIITLVNASLLATRGGDIVYISGFNFGASNNNLKATYAPYNATTGLPIAAATPYQANSCIIIVPHRRMSCSSAAGIGAGHRWIVEVGAQLSLPSADAPNSTTSYLKPVITRLGGAGADQATTAGGQPVIITGLQFGPITNADANGNVRDSDVFLAPGAQYGRAIQSVTKQSSLNFTGIGCRVTVTDTQIVCYTNEGSGNFLHWGVTVGFQESGIFWGQTTNYAPPVIAYYSGDGSHLADTTGGQDVFIYGKNLGPIGTPIDKVVYDSGPNSTQFQGRNCAVTTPHVTMRCQTDVGAGAGLLWKVWVDQQESTMPTTDYATPEVRSLSGPGAVDAATDGGDIVILTGRYFSINQFLESVTYGPSGTEYKAGNCSVTVDHVEITCMTVPGTGRSLRWVVTVAGQVSFPSAVTSSYGLPTITSIVPLGGPTEGGYLVRIEGRNFALGVQGVLPVVRIDATGHPSPSVSDLAAYWGAVQAGSVPSASVAGSVSTWVYELVAPKLESANIDGFRTHVLTFKMPVGFGPNRSMFITVNNVPSAVSLFSYDPPFITHCSPDRIGVPDGYLRVFIDGTSFCSGVDGCGMVLFDGVPQIASNWSHKQIMVIAPANANASTTSVTVVVGGVVSNIGSFSKPEPSFDAIVDQGTWRDMLTQGNQDFFIAHVDSISSLDESDITILIGTRECTGVKKTVDQDTSAANGIPPGDPRAENYRRYQLACKTPPGIGTDLPIMIYVPGGGHSADYTNQGFTFSYRAPTITDVQDALMAREIADSYLHPLTATGLPANGVPTVGRRLRLVGSCFGSQTAVTGWTGAFVQVVLATTVYTLTAQNVTDTELYVDLPTGQGASIDITVTVGGQSSRDPYYFSATTDPQTATLIRYKAPTITSITPRGLPTTGGSMIALYGSDFGTASAASSQARGLPIVQFSYLDGSQSACALDPTYTPLSNHTMLRCFLPEGQGADVPVTVTVAGQTSNVFGYTYALPQVFSITPTYGPTSGRTADGQRINMTLVGLNLGTFGSGNVQLRPSDPFSTVEFVVNVPVETIFVHNHTTIMFPMPEGGGENLNVVAVIAGQVSSEPVTFSYNPPVISSIYLDGKLPGQCDDLIDDHIVINGTRVIRYRPAGCYPTRGGYKLNIKGESFTALKPIVTIGGRTTDVVSFGHTQVVVTVPQGYGDHNEVVVTAMGRASPVTNETVFGYDPPQVLSFSPNVPDARGEDIEMDGYNFGFESLPLEIYIGGLWCDNPRWYNDGMVSCSGPPDVVGLKNVSVLAANRSEPYVWLAEEKKITYECKYGFSGMNGEVCVDCNQAHGGFLGAVCPGGELYWDKVYSMPGWWRTNISDPALKINCHPLRRQRDACPVFQPCEPAESCTGANTCAEGYTGDRCALCLTGKYYRVNGECIKCPDSPWAVVVIFVMGAVFALGAAYIMNKKNISLALISIGMDYFQIVAMFARTKIRWPPLVKQVFLILSAFNFNLEIIAPECAIPEVSYSGKWLFIEGLPVMGWVLLCVLHIIQYTYKRLCTTKRKDALWSHLPQLLSTGIVVLRVLYIYITRTTFDIFNCAPTDPPDGNEYMAYNLSIICYQPGGTHLFLLPFAVAASLIYVGGAPVLAMLHMYRNSYKIKYDQVLRAQGLGNDSVTNPRYLMFRRMWSKLYFHFKPSHFYWEGVITLKKFLIAFVSLMLRKTASYQLACALLVLFAAFVLHMRNLPYLTHSSSRTVMRDHTRAALEGDPVHARIATEMREAALQNQRKRKKMSFGRKESFSTSQLPWTAHRAQLNQALMNKYSLIANLIDYNSVEAVLLACAILVNLAGIMFDSARFSGDNAVYYADEYDSLAYVTMCLLFGSIMYFLTVFAIDLYIVCAPTSSSKCFDGCARGFNAAIGKKRLMAAAARMRGSKFMTNMLDAEAGKGGMGGPGGDDPDGLSSFHHNPLVSANGGLSSRYEGGVSIGGYTADELESMLEPPNASTWPVLRGAMRDMHAKLLHLTRTTADMQLQLEQTKGMKRLPSSIDPNDIEGLDTPSGTPMSSSRGKAMFGAVSPFAVNGPSKTDAVLRLRDLRKLAKDRLDGKVEAALPTPEPIQLVDPNVTPGRSFILQRPKDGTRRGDYVWDDGQRRWVHKPASLAGAKEEKKEKKVGNWFSLPKVATATGGMSWLKESSGKQKEKKELEGKEDKKSSKDKKAAALASEDDAGAAKYEDNPLMLAAAASSSTGAGTGMSNAHSSSSSSSSSATNADGSWSLQRGASSSSSFRRSKSASKEGGEAGEAGSFKAKSSRRLLKHPLPSAAEDDDDVPSKRAGAAAASAGGATFSNPIAAVNAGKRQGGSVSPPTSSDADEPAAALSDANVEL